MFTSNTPLQAFISPAISGLKHREVWSPHDSIAVKRNHDQRNSYKRKHLIVVLLTVSEAKSIMVESMVVGRCGPGKVAENYSLIHSRGRKGEGEGG